MQIAARKLKEYHVRPGNVARLASNWQSVTLWKELPRMTIKHVVVDRLRPNEFCLVIAVDLEEWSCLVLTSENALGWLNVGDLERA